jgi:hypothetical protein
MYQLDIRDADQVHYTKTADLRPNPAGEWLIRWAAYSIRQSAGG